MCREINRADLALKNEWSLAPKYWPAITESIQFVINHAPLKLLCLRDTSIANAYRTPLEVFTENKPFRPLLRALSRSEYEHAHSTDELKTIKIWVIEKI